jgi:hypothetical protein
MTPQEHTITPSDWHPRRVVVTGYYDGPTEGIIHFGDDIGIYCFKAVAFDFDREMRVLKLSRVTSEQFESVLHMFPSTLGQPEWPFWVPIWNASGADENARRTTATEIDALCARGEPVAAVLTDDTIEKCLAIRKIDAHSDSVIVDWLSLFA